MPASLNLGGGVAGVPGGAISFKPETATGTKSTPELQTIELAAGVETKIKLPLEASYVALAFQFAGASPPTVLFKTNLNSGDTGLQVPAEAFFATGLGGATEVILKAATPPKAFQLYVQ